MLKFSIIISAIEFAFVCCAILLSINYDRFLMGSLILFTLPLLPLSIVTLVRSIRSILTSQSKPKAIIATALSGAAIINFILLISLMVFMFSQGGRLPHEVFY